MKLPIICILNDNKNSQGNNSIFIDTQLSMLLAISILVFISLLGCYFAYIMLLPTEYGAP
jgi:hypothetical protein